MSERFLGFHLDFLGFLASFLCAIHCAAIPIVLTMGFFGGLSWISDPLVEVAFLTTSLTIAAATLLISVRRQQMTKMVLILFMMGFSLLLISRLLPHAHGIELVFAVAGGLSVATAHVYHWIHLRKCAVSL
jgi:hypothetical protein